MYTTMETRRAHAEGRAEQFAEMMAALSALESKYSGVRGALLKKVREDLEKTKPPGDFVALRSASAPAAVSSPRCSACGRELKMNGTDGRLMCMNGHYG